MSHSPTTLTSTLPSPRITRSSPRTPAMRTPRFPVLAGPCCSTTSPSDSSEATTFGCRQAAGGGGSQRRGRGRCSLDSDRHATAPRACG
jgi:hypothetical protein